MMTLDQFQDVLGDALFAGNTDVAGIVIFTVALALTFMVMKKNVFAALIISIPMAFVFMALGALSPDMMMILIVISVLGLATVSKKTLGE